LLVLDNMEHLLLEDGPDTQTGTTLALIESILSAAPELKIMITSRELLRLPQEKAFQVRGLPHGDEASILETSHDDAYELFRLRAQKMESALERVSAEDDHHVRRICRMVEGMPLAIELAAGQLRLLSPVEISREIANNLDILDTGLRGAAARHSSVRIVFENSWNRLKDGEKLILARLSVFQGGFTHQAAASVVQAKISDLANLLDKSLIQRGAGGRFVLHALVQMFTVEKLAEMPDELAQTRDRHFRFYRDLVGESVSQWRTCHESSSLDIISPEVDNLRAGWDSILSQEDWDEIAAYLDDLWQFFKVRGRLPEAMELLTLALQAGRSAEPVADTKYQAHWELLLGQAYLWMSQLGEGDEHFRQTLSLLGWPVPGSQAGLLKSILIEFMVQVLHRAWPGYFLGRLEQKQSEAREAYTAYERLGNRAVVENETLLGFYCGFRCLNLTEAAGLNRQMARAYAVTGYMYALIPNRKIARSYFSRAEIIARQEDCPDVWESVSRVLGFYFTTIGRWRSAASHFRRAAQAAAELGWHWEQETDWLGLLMVAYQMGEFERGLKYAHRISVSANQRGDAGFIAAGLYWQAFFKVRQGEDLELIIDLLKKSAAAPSEVMNDLDWIIVFSSLAQAYLRQGKDKQASREINKATRMIAGITRPANPLSFLGYADVAAVYLTLWEKSLDSQEWQVLRQSAHQACEDLNLFARILPAGRPLIWLYRGLYDWLDGRPQKAHTTWQKSLALAEDLNIPYDQGRIHYQIGRHLSEGEITEKGWGRQEHLQRAAEIFSELGAAYDLVCVEAELSS
jgi:predicted ATPase/Tfp pilus assembly protein PilF